MLSQQRNFKAEHGPARLRADARPVHVDAHLTAVGVDFDLGGVLAAVFIALAAEVDEGLPLVPGGLVEIKRVLAQRAVKGHKPLLVFAVLPALVAAVGGKVKEIPHMRRPEIGPRLDHFEHMLVVQRLVFLGIIALFGAGGVEGGVGVRTVFGKADDALGVFRVVFVEKLIGLLQLAQIPAEVEVIAVDVGDFQDGAVDLQHEHVRHGGEPRGIHPMAQLVERPVVFQQFLIHGAGCGDLVRQAPDRDAGMVVTLGDELTHLVQRVLPPVVHVHGDVGDLRPDHNAVLVAEIIKVLRVLVVGQAQGVGAQFADDVHVSLVVVIGEGVALALEILVTAHAAERVAAAVEEEALFGVAGKDAAAEARGDLITGGQLRRGSIEIGIVHTVPEAHVFNRKLRRALDGLRFAVYGNIHRSGVVPGLHGDGRRFLFQIHDRGHFDPRGAVLQQFKVLRRNSNQLHRAVEPAVKGKIRLLRVHRRIVLVAHAHGQYVLFGKFPAQLHPEGRVSALVTAELFAVEKHIAAHGRAAEFQEQPLSSGFFCRQLAHIPAASAVIVVAAVLAVYGVPGVRQRDGFALRGIGHGGIDGDGGFQKPPSLGESCDLTHFSDLLYAVLPQRARSEPQPSCRRCVSAPLPSQCGQACTCAWPAVCR